ncbi:MAG: RsmB/NOP family class I SAM-dependent RNA methyltransferase [Pseudomonadota bacterium]
MKPTRSRSFGAGKKDRPPNRPIGKEGLASRQAATLVLTRVIDDGRGLDGLLEGSNALGDFTRLSANDRALVRAIITSALRHRGEIQAALAEQFDRPPPKNARHFIHTLQVAAAQILYLDVPDSAAVDLAVSQVASDPRSKRFKALANAVLRGLVRRKAKGPMTFKQPLGQLNTPDWFFRRLRSAYGKEKALAIGEAHLLEPIIDLQVKSDPEQWAKRLGGVHLFGNTVRVNQKGDLTGWEGYADGAWWVQDAAAALPVGLLGELNGRITCDLCAAPGGKTAQMANAGARVTALEISDNRRKRLDQNMERLGFDVDVVTTDLLTWEPPHLFDAVLLDAPCSSTGTMRRHPDVAWTKSADMVIELAALQKSMVLSAAKLVKPGGVLVFANCSIDRAEGEDVYAGIIKMGAEVTELEPDSINAEEVYGMSELITGQGTLRSLPIHGRSFPAPSAASPEEVARFKGLDGFFAGRFRKAAL